MLTLTLARSLILTLARARTLTLTLTLTLTVTVDDLSRHLERCEGELHKFEEELREKGQLKTPANVKASAPPSDPSGAGGSDGAAGRLRVLTRPRLRPNPDPDPEP